MDRRTAPHLARFAAGIAALLLGGALPLTAHAQDITVSAAVSLQNAFKEIGGAFERAHPGTRLHFNFAGSGPLLIQIAQGAPVDVFASADQQTMDQAQAKQLLRPGSRLNFASNQLVLVSPQADPPTLHSLTDLLKPGLSRIALGNPLTVPAGRYAQASLGAAGLLDTLRPRFVHADNVRQALNYVSRGEVRAAFVYRTDALLDRAQVRIDLAVPMATPPSYPIAMVAASTQPSTAARFIAFVAGPTGQDILQRHGFGKPPAAG